MFGFARFGATALALAVLALPAIAQTPADPAVRDHRNGPRPVAPPPATPGIVRDHRGIAATEVMQWEVRDLGPPRPNVEFSIVNIYREEHGLLSQFGHYDKDWPNPDTVGWGPGGGSWTFKRQDGTNVNPLDENDFVAIYNTRAKAYLVWFGVWSSSPAYDWQLRGLKLVGANRYRFALYNIKMPPHYVYACENKTSNEHALCHPKYPP